MLAGYVSDETYAALADVAVELRGLGGVRCVTKSAPSGAVYVDVAPGIYEICLSKPGFGSKRVRVEIGSPKPVHFRLLSDRMLGYTWPKWCRSGERVQFRVHAVEPYKLGLWRYGLRKEFVRNVGWYDDHGPRACMQTVPDGFFVEHGVAWDHGAGVHKQVIAAPERSGLYYFHAKAESGAFFSFPLVVAPAKPQAAIAVLASTNTWNAYNPFGGRSNYIMAAHMIDEPIVNAKSDLPRYKLSNYGEWKSAPEFDPLSFDRPEPINFVPENVERNGGCSAGSSGRGIHTICTRTTSFTPVFWTSMRIACSSWASTRNTGQRRCIGSLNTGSLSAAASSCTWEATV
jgi:N,N-dimethylformamidase